MNSETRRHYWRTHRAAEAAALLNPEMIRKGQTFPCAVERFVIGKLGLRAERMWGASCDARAARSSLRYEIKSRKMGSDAPFELEPADFDRLVVCEWESRLDRAGAPFLHASCRIVDASELCRSGKQKLNDLLGATPVRLRGWVRLPRAG